MPVQLSSAEGVPETAVKTRKRPFMMTVAILFPFFFARLPRQSGRNYSNDTGEGNNNNMLFA